MHSIHMKFTELFYFTDNNHKMKHDVYSVLMFTRKNFIRLQYLL